MRFEANDDEYRDMIRERYSSWASTAYCYHYREINKFTSLPGSRNDHNFFGGTGGGVSSFASPTSKFTPQQDEFNVFQAKEIDFRTLCKYRISTQPQERLLSVQ